MWRDFVSGELPTPDLRNLDIYQEIGLELDLENIEALSDANYAALYEEKLAEWDAVRVPPGSWRGYEAGPEGLELLVIGAPNLGENPRDDAEGTRDWWTD